ncbi:hypothetical protein [Salinispora sp. H7-4]|uniref:hypothetical protein n=1 Tax=Salinispora sp. H7-4 TaxID=2748321 RepID=UPI00210708F6|nr:hypothetical protein [Salinispora sp. H7-4]
MNRAFVLLAAGHRAGRRAGAGAVMHRWSLAVAAAVALLTAWTFISIAAMYDARNASVAAREPVFLAQGQDEGAVARWIPHSDRVNNRQFLVVYHPALRHHSCSHRTHLAPAQKLRGWFGQHPPLEHLAVARSSPITIVTPTAGTHCHERDG